MSNTAPVKIIALHGAGMNGRVYGSLATLATAYHFQTLSFPGHDRNLGGRVLQDIGAMADWALSKLEGRCILLGHSMGALVALEMAAHEDVAGVMVMGAATEMPVNADLLKTAQDDPKKAQQLITKWSVSSAHPQADIIRAVLEEQMRGVLDPLALYNDLFACNDYHHGKEALAALQKPLLVIAGGADKMVKPDASRAMADTARIGRYAEIDAAGHMMMVEKPVETMNEIKQFIQSIPR